MLVQELRIGNLVEIDNKDFHPKLKDIPFEINSILLTCYGHKNISTWAIGLEYLEQEENKYYQSYSQFIHFIKPIPLTEEWLVKLNWKRLDKYTFTLNGSFIYVRKRGFVTGSKKREIQLPYVHDLQNWYYYNNNKKELEFTNKRLS